MFVEFFLALREAKVPVSIKECLALIEAVDTGLAEHDTDKFYYLSRATMVKDERHLDRFDRAFGQVFKGLAPVEKTDSSQTEIPEEWVRRLTERHLTEEEKAQIDALGGWKALMETLRRCLEEQRDRHQGGNKWIGTAGTSPFGSYG